MTTEPQDTTLEDEAENEDKDKAEVHYWAAEDKAKAHRMAAENKTRACREAAIRSLRRCGRSCNRRCKSHTLEELWQAYRDTKPKANQAPEAAKVLKESPRVLITAEVEENHEGIPTTGGT